MLEQALELASRGLAVFPLHHMQGDGVIEWACSCGRSCSSPGKHPRTQQGCKDASRAEPAIREWWTRWPDANIGIATGTPSGVYVVDLDGEEGVATWKATGIKHAGARAITGSGGWHLYFALALGEVMPNTAGRIGPKVDTRGEGGYVVAPPSNHRSGGSYRWREGEWKLPPIPAELLTLLAPKTDTPVSPPRLADSSSAYGEGVLVNACRRIAAAAEGTRNATLNDEAFLVGQFIGGGEIDPAGVEQLLAESCYGPDKKKNHATVRRALHAGMMHGRQAPEND